MNWIRTVGWQPVPILWVAVSGLVICNPSRLPAQGCDTACAQRASYCGGPGTLFRWSAQPAVTGGPDLNEPLVTDRPDFTEASSTVGLGVLQIEAGYTYSFDDDGPGSTKSHSYPETLFRYGLFRDWLELRIAWNHGSQDLPAAEASGGEDLYLGFKLALTPQSGCLPEMALIPQMTVPTGDSDFTAERVLAGLNWIYAWEINEFLSTAGSTQFNTALDETTSAAYTEWAQSWVFGFQLCDRLVGYTEWFGMFAHGADSARPQNYFNGGFGFLVSNDIQWDIRGGVGLDDAADDYFVGTGLSIRFR